MTNRLPEFVIFMTDAKSDALDPTGSARDA
jgi:hypothetical protein